MTAEVDTLEAWQLGVEYAVRRVVADEEKPIGEFGEVYFPSVNSHLAGFEAMEPERGEGSRVAVIKKDNRWIRILIWPAEDGLQCGE